MPVDESLSEPQISPRESTWIALCARGLKDHQIASEMGITIHTVRFHANALMKKLGAKSRANAVYIVMKRGELERSASRSSPGACERRR